MAAQSFYEVLTAAVADLTEHGFDSADRIAYWQDRLRAAAEQTMASDHQMREMLVQAYRAIYAKMVERGDIAKMHQGIGRFTLERVKPQLRNELDRRILAAADLIRLNREDAIATTLRRFSGWATSIPAGGSETVDRVKTKTDIRKALASLPFEERRVLVDQGHKFTASLSDILARDGGAIAGRWYSHWRQAGYRYRKDHKERDGNVYAVRGSWALKDGLMKAGAAGYTDEITRPAEEVFCRCRYTWIYALRNLPTDMLTKKGAAELARVRMELASA